MKIPNKTIKKWNDLKEEGDIALLASEIGKSEPTVYKIFNTGIAKVEDAEKINEFYKKRIRRAKKVVIEDDNN